MTGNKTYISQIGSQKFESTPQLLLAYFPLSNPYTDWRSQKIVIPVEDVSNADTHYGSF